MISHRDAPFIIFAALIMSVTVFTIAWMTFWMTLPPSMGYHMAGFFPRTNARQMRFVPMGYSVERYRVAERTEKPCLADTQCVLPGSYAMQSNCPYAAWCIENRCTIVCPQYQQP